MGNNKWWTLAAVGLGTFMLLLDITIVSVALPPIERSLGATFSELQWVVDAYSLTLAALLLTGGSLADLFGRRKVFVAGVAAFSSGSLLCGFATSPLFLILSRGVQGVGGAAMFSTALALLANAFGGRERGVAFGVWGAVTGIAVAVGPVLGGLITSGLSWRWIFFVNAPFGVAAIVVSLTRVEESREPSGRRVDWPGLAVFSAALASLVYGLIRASEQGFSDAGVLACLAIAALGVAAFVLLERRSASPMFDLGLFKVPTFVGGLVAAFGLSVSVFSILLYLVLYLQDALGYSALQAGLRLLIISGAILVVSSVSGRLSASVPVRALIGPGLVVSGTSLFAMAGLSGRSSWTHLVVGFILAGVGAGLVNPPLASTAVGVVAPSRAGMASGINSTLRQVGIATGIAALGSLFAMAERQAVTGRASKIPGLAAYAGQIATALRNGAARAVLARIPPPGRPRVEVMLRASFASGLDEILVIGGALACASGVTAFFLIRGQDFVSTSAAGPSRPSSNPPVRDV